MIASISSSSMSLEASSNADSCQYFIPSGYANTSPAIEMALGAAIQNIVKDTEQDAKKIIEYLRKNNLGRASFLPISSVTS